MKTMLDHPIFQEECCAIMGACFAVYQDKGCGFLEPVYQECLEIEFEHLEFPATPKPPLPLSYRGKALDHLYEPDFICCGKIVLEIKAVSALIDVHRAQVLNCLNATGFKLGLLVNFGHYPDIEWERIANDRNPRCQELDSFRVI